MAQCDSARPRALHEKGTLAPALDVVHRDRLDLIGIKMAPGLVCKSFWAAYQSTEQKGLQKRYLLTELYQQVVDLWLLYGLLLTPFANISALC